jgi:hypothetical protein
MKIKNCWAKMVQKEYRKYNLTINPSFYSSQYRLPRCLSANASSTSFTVTYVFSVSFKSPWNLVVKRNILCIGIHTNERNNYI